MINIIRDVNLFDNVSEYDCTLVAANIYGSMKDGFAFEVRQEYTYVHLKNLSTKYGDIRKLGTITEAKEDGKPTFCLCYMYKNNVVKEKDKDYTDYEALEKCLKLVNILYKGKKLGSTIMGNSKFDGNGDKDRILEIFRKTLTDVDIDLYDFEQECRNYMVGKNIRKVIALKKENKMEEYKRFLEYSKNKFKGKKYRTNNGRYIKINK